jgi:periplasmic protein TonB
VSAPRRKKRRYVPIALLGLSVTLIGAGTFAMMRSFLNSPAGAPKQVIQEIHLMRPPPPPPDLPPPPPPPPEEKVEVQQPKPEPTQSNDPPPGQQLGLDADASSGGDAFGLLANKGGRDLLGHGNAYVWYAGLLKDQILSQLNENSAARRGDYSLVVQVWVRSDGTIDRVHVAQGSGDRARDQAIEQTLSRMSRLNQAPPADMPEPINLRIVSRG